MEFCMYSTGWGTRRGSEKGFGLHDFASNAVVFQACLYYVAALEGF